MSNHVRAGMRALLAMLLISFAAREASAQGCILFRESAPLFGPLSGTYLQPDEWEVTGSLRGSTALEYGLPVVGKRRRFGTRDASLARWRVPSN